MAAILRAGYAASRRLRAVFLRRRLRPCTAARRHARGFGHGQVVQHGFALRDSWRRCRAHRQRNHSAPSTIQSCAPASRLTMAGKPQANASPYQPKRLVERGHEKHVRRAVMGHVGHTTGEMHAIRHADVHGLRLDLAIALSCPPTIPRAFAVAGPRFEEKPASTEQSRIRQPATSAHSRECRALLSWIPNSVAPW